MFPAIFVSMVCSASPDFKHKNHIQVWKVLHFDIGLSVSDYLGVRVLAVGLH
jgi:hypothetical protein